MTGTVRRRSGAGFACAAFTTALIIFSAVATVYAQDELTMLEDTVEGPYALAGTLHVTDPQALSLLVAIDHQDADNTYAVRLTPGATTIERIAGGNAVAIGRGRAHGPFEADSDLELTVRRDGWRIEVIVDREVLARAWDSILPAGAVGYQVAGGEIVEPMLQPIGGVYMTDPFERLPNLPVQGTWEDVQGTWKLQSLRMDEQSDRMEADKSANAFSYLGRSADGPGITCTGYWFWNDYSIAAAVRPIETDTLGLVAYFQNPENYIAARWTSALSEAEDADRLQLVAVVGGRQSVLAEGRGGHIPGQWYRLELRVCDGLVQVFVDDEPRLAARADLFGQGQPGLYCEGSAGTSFDSVVIEDWQVLADDFEQSSPGRWVVQNGTWRVDGGKMRGAGAGAVAFTGRREWGRYAHAADLAVDGRAGVGLVACGVEGRYFALRIGGRGSGVPYEGQAQLVRVEGGQATVLASTPAAVDFSAPHRARLVVDEGLLTGYLDDKRILDAFDVDATGGLIGLYADGGGAGVFDNVYLTMLPPRRIARVAKEFAESDEHPEMVEWASTRAPWIKPEDDGGTWWTKGDYYGDKSIVFDIPRVGQVTGEVRLRLDTEPDDPQAGLTLVIAAQQGSKTLELTLLHGEEQVGQTTYEVASEPCPVRFERRGTWAVVVIDGSVVFNEKL